MVIAHLVKDGEWSWNLLSVMPFACLGGTAIMFLLFAPLHLLLSGLRLTNKWAFLAAGLVAFAVAYLLNVDSIWPKDSRLQKDLISELLAQPISILAFLVPFIGIPVGLLFHLLVFQFRLRQPFGTADLFVGATLILALVHIALMSPLLALESHLQIEPSNWRYEFVRWIFLLGAFTIPWAGLLAVFMRLVNQRASLAIACLGWALPAALPVGLLVLNSEPRIRDYSVSGRTYGIPLRYEPRTEDGGKGFSFDAARRGPFADGRVGNQRLYVSDAAIPPFVDPHRPDADKIVNTQDGEFEVEQYVDKLRRAVRT
jgi:hypothetical protein